MKEIMYKLEVLTPLFMGGAEARLNPELRPPSIRGSLRYWYRAVLGGAGDREDQKKDEADVFGSTEKGSKVSLSLRPEGIPRISTFTKDKAIRTAAGDYLPTGKDYLLWSMAESGRPGTPKHLPAREYIEPGTIYTLYLRSRLGLLPLKQASAALWLLGNLGSLGSRARRGAGSIQVTIKQTSDSASLPTVEFRVCDSIASLKAYLEQGLLDSKTAVLEEGAAWNQFGEIIPAYDVLSPDTTSIWIVANHASGWNSSLEALQGLGERFRDFRTHLNPTGIGKADHDAVLEWLTHGKPVPEIQRAAFGLPIPFHYSGGGPGDIIISTQGDRRASPLHIRATRLSTGKYVGVLTLFKSSFLDASGKQQLLLQTRNWKAPVPPDYQVIHDFVATFPVHQAVIL